MHFGRIVWNYLIYNIQKYGWHSRNPTKDAWEGKGTLISMEKRIRMKITYKQVFSWTEQGATLEIMAEMDWHPGHRPETANYPMTSDTFDKDNGYTESTRTLYHQMNPHPEVIPQWLPNTWPKCLGRGAPLHCNSWPPSPTPSSTSSNSSGPPSLESLTKPESGYEAMKSSTMSSDTD